MRRRAKSAKAKVEAQPPVSRTPPKNEGAEIRDPEKRLAEALKQQAATAEILRLIGSSPADVQPVFDAIVQNAVRLCGAVYASVYRFDGELIHLVANHNYAPEPLEAWQRTFPRPLNESGRLRDVLTTGDILRVADVLAAEGFSPAGLATMCAMGVHSVLLVPILRPGPAIGVISLMHRDVGAFTDAHVELLKTFADQAVIAIENARLFSETKEALTRQTATAEILRVISSSPTDVQPVFDAILRSAVTLCDALFGAIFRTDGDVVEVAALAHPRPEDVSAIYPAPLASSLFPCIAIRENKVLNVPDVDAVGVLPQAARQIVRGTGVRSLLTVPMRRDTRPVGAILISRPAPGPFTDEQVALLQTFADQTVIAIENVRLFRELEEKNLALTQAHAQVTESLEHQTATSEVLKIISRSTFDLQPVLENVVESATRLCTATRGHIFRFDGEFLRFAAAYGAWPTFTNFLKRNPTPLSRGSISDARLLSVGRYMCVTSSRTPTTKWASW